MNQTTARLKQKPQRPTAHHSGFGIGGAKAPWVGHYFPVNKRMGAEGGALVLREPPRACCPMDKSKRFARMGLLE